MHCAHPGMSSFYKLVCAAVSRTATCTRKEGGPLSPIYMGILIQILIHIGCVYTEANWIQIQTQTTSPIWIVIQIQIRIRDLVLM